LADPAINCSRVGGGIKGRILWGVTFFGAVSRTGTLVFLSPFIQAAYVVNGFGCGMLALSLVEAQHRSEVAEYEV
jgi:hypothetical protein